METGKYIEIKNLEVYRLARELSKLAWEIYEKLDWQTKKIMGYQFIESADSVGANIAEGYGRFHYLDKIKFYYNSRASLLECAEHWLELLYERKKINQEDCSRTKLLQKKLSVKLNNFIASNYESRRVYDNL